MSKAAERCESIESYLGELAAKLERPEHKRLLEAYRGDDPVGAMEEEYRRILLEVLQGED